MPADSLSTWDSVLDPVVCFTSVAREPGFKSWPDQDAADGAERWWSQGICCEKMDSTMALPPHRDQAATMTMFRTRRKEILAAAERDGASNVLIYGSLARGEARPVGDIDVLVDMAPGRSLLDLAAFRLELEEIVGYPVEIGTDVKPRLGERVRAEAVAL